jgi:Ca2+-binding EF-hand superfamily protein
MAGKAIKITGRSGRFDFCNDQYEPMQIKHNDKTCFVARAVAPRYLFHTGKNRWVISKVLDDGYRCWAYLQATSDSQDPTDCRGQWTFCDADGEWRPDPAVSHSGVAATTDKFVQLRLTLDGEMRQYGLIEKTELKKLWRRLDYNGNNVVSLAEIDKMVVELVAGGVWPSWLNNKPALMRAYKKTILKDGDGDDWVEKKEFHALLLNIFWFNKLYLIFDQVDGDDRRIDQREFQAGLSKLGLHMSADEASKEFAKIDTNHGGQVLFVEFCKYVRERVSPDAHAEFDADIVSGEHCGRARYNTAHHGHHSHHGHHGHHATREISSRGLPMESTNRSPTETMRSLGGYNHSTTNDQTFKPKAFRDFDELENKIKDLCRDHAGLKKQWSRLDFNGNGIVSLAEIDKWAVETYPLLNHKPALMRCYKCTIVKGKHHDDWVHRCDFKKLIVNLFYFNKLYWIFDECNGDDRRMTYNEFKQCHTLCGCKIDEGELRRDFAKADHNGGGMILFDEFCHYFASKACPESLTEFTDDGMDRTDHDGTGAVFKRAGHARYHATGHGHVERNHY